MFDDQIKGLQELFEGKIDFHGQQLVEQISKIVLVFATALSFFVGLALQSLLVTFAIFGGMTALLALIVLPPWSMFNRNPVQWQGSGTGAESKKGR